MRCVYRITIREQPTLEFETWFEGLRVSDDAAGKTILELAVADQAELVSVLTRLHHLNLTLLSVSGDDDLNNDSQTANGE